jgi:bifunctional non-homologous end joining protein LigD
MKDTTSWYPEITSALSKLRGSFICDGLPAMIKACPTLNPRSRAVRKTGPLVTYFAFDLLFQNGRDLRPLPLIERKRRSRKLILSEARLRYVTRFVGSTSF